jgi:hypothetical protein
MVYNNSREGGKMKKFFGKVSKLPSPLLYILLIVVLGLFVFCFPKLSLVLGFIWENGIIGIFVLGAIVSIAVAIADRPKKQ